MNFKIIYENENYIVIEKPAGVLVHPTAANEPDTLVGYLEEKYPDFKKQNWVEPERAGIVHRLDKETSGLIIMAKNPQTLKNLQNKFREREVKKTYQALVAGRTPDTGKIDVPIVRDNQKDMMRTQIMSFSFSRGTAREAITEFKIIARYKYKKDDLSLVEVYPATGRMHQIRVHMKHEGFPLIGDPLYINKLSKRISKELNIERQFLHAVKLEIDGHIFESELADDLMEILGKLKEANE
jgi:23S rRNA pseudouridine1911/1915/1917 synthase